MPHVEYIFCAELCSWFGKGPVYLAFTGYDKQARNISLARRPAGYSIKVPFVSRPEYTGPILVRGRRLGTGDKVPFDGGGQRNDDFKLLAPSRAEATRWSFWPAGMLVSRPGCYGLQIDTSKGTDVIIFEAVAR